MAGGIEDDTYTYDLASGDGGPRRPSLHDLGGDEMVDDDPAPKKFEQPTAAWGNGINRTVAGLARVVGTVDIWVEFVSGSPQIINTSAMGTLVNTTSFTPTLTSPGVVEIAWIAGTLPPVEREPKSWLNSGPGMIYAERDGSNQYKIIVYTHDATGAPANRNFGVTIG
jgi:hypothetical protein